MNLTKKEYKLIYKNIPKIRKEINNINKIRYLKNKIPLSRKKIYKIIDDKISNTLDKKILDKVNYIHQIQKKKYKNNKYFTIDGIDTEFYNFENIYEWSLNMWESHVNDRFINTQKNINNYLTEYNKDFNHLYIQEILCRWVDYKRIIYGSIFSLNMYLEKELLDLFDEILKEKIPNMVLVERKSEEYNETGNVISIETRACGKEEIINKLKKDSLNDIKTFISSKIEEIEEKLENKIFINYKKLFINTNIEEEIIEIIIPTKKTAKNISTKNFILDLEKLEQPIEYFFNILNELKNEYTKKLIKKIEEEK